MELLQEAIERSDSKEIINLYNFCDNEIYKALIISDLDRILIKATPDLCSHLSMIFLGHEYADVYDKLYKMNEFKLAIRNRNIRDMMIFSTLLKEDIVIEILAINIDYLMEANHILMSSFLATYFCFTKYQNEYNKVCIDIRDKLANDSIE